MNSLNESKKITDDIKAKLKTAKAVQERINKNRNNYNTVAVHAAFLYFCVQELLSLGPLYQFSMKWFRELFVASFVFSSERDKDVKGLARQLKQDFLRVLFANLCHSLL